VEGSFARAGEDLTCNRCAGGDGGGRPSVRERPTPDGIPDTTDPAVTVVVRSQLVATVAGPRRATIRLDAPPGPGGGSGSGGVGKTAWRACQATRGAPPARRREQAPRRCGRCRRGGRRRWRIDGIGRVVWVRLSWSDVVKPTTRDFVVGRAVSAPSGEPFARRGARSRRMGSSGAPSPRWS